MMFLQPLWTALQFVQWEDTISFHARLFRCFLLGFLDAHGELAFLSQGSEQMLTFLGQRLAGVGLMHDAGHLHEPLYPLGRHSDATTRCPPKRRYEATSLPSFAVNSPMDQTMPAPPFVFSHPINLTHGLYDQPISPATAFDLPGSGWVLGGYGGPPIGVVGFILLWLLTLAIVISYCSSTGSSPTRAMCRPPRITVDSTTNSGERVIRPLSQDHLLTNEATRSVIAGAPEDVGHRVSMPGAWLHERYSVLGTHQESAPNTMPWTLFYLCAQTGMKAWAHFPGLTSIFAVSDSLNHGSNDIIIIRGRSEDGSSPVCQGLGLNVVELDADPLTPAALNGTEQQDAAQDHLPTKSDLSIEDLQGSITAAHNRRCEPLAIGEVTIKVPDPAWTTSLHVVCGDNIGLTFSLATSSNVERLLCQEDISSDLDESASSTEDEGLIGIDTQRTDISALEGKDEYRVLGRRQDGSLSDASCPPPLRRARSTGYLWKKRDMFDDEDEGTGGDSYWTEQVNARLSGERDSRQAACQFGWTDVSSWPREGREDETDNWRARNSQVTQFAAPEKTSGVVQCQANSDNTKLRRYSSPPLNVDTSLTHRASGGDGPQGIYVVPQKRGRTAGGRCWSPVPSPRPSDRPSGLGFFPFRNTPPLLTPEAWRPGCLYVPDPPVDESRQADAWWDNLSVGGCGGASGTVIQDAAQGPPFSGDAQDAPVSWRDKYENDPASRRFTCVHRRAITEG